MPVKLYLDEDVRPLLARVLRDRGVDCVSTREADNLACADAEQLAFAANHGRTLVTFNVKDFVSLAQVYAEADRHHRGIILSDHLPFGILLRRLLRLLHEVGDGDLSDRLIWLHTYKTE
jgi:hypothetical protein